MSKPKRPPALPPPPELPGSEPPSGTARVWLPRVAVMLVAAAIGAFWQMRQKPAYISVPMPAAPSNGKAKLPTGPVVEDEKTTFADYAGHMQCIVCHAAEFEKWKGSHHGLAERSFDDALDKTAFEPAKTFKHGTQQSTAQLGAGGKAEVIATGFNNETKPYPVERVIGHDPLRQFLVQGSGGRLHTLEATWDPHKSEWFNVFANEDRKPGEWGHWTGRGMVWNTMCASCHNTRVRKNYDSKTDSFHTTMAQATVSCEACHGPMKKHAEWQTANPGVKPDPTAKKLTRDQMLDSCAMCHARRSELTGDFKPGDNFFDHHSLSIVDHSDIFYPDGQIRDEDYEFSSFLSSRMHAAGVRCVDCHDPHSGKRILPGNNLCMRCHTQGGFPNAPVIVPAAHTFHLPESTGSQCVNCHMPQTTYMQRHPRHDHGFTIPDPLLTQQFNIPNACNKCHTDKDTAWSLAAVEKWYGPKMERRTRQRGTIMAKARRGDDDARDGLLSVLAGDETPYWKASASLLLDRWLNEESVREALQKQLEHPHPMVRGSAVQSLAPLVESHDPGVLSKVEPLLEDPSRNVRVAAAWALRDHLDLGTVAGKELQHMLELNTDQPSGQMQMGQFEFARQNIAKAIEHMGKAVEWDPNSPPFRRDLAMMHNIAGDMQSSLKQLQEAIRLNPNEAQYHYELGLAWNEARNMDNAIASLRAAVKLEARLARAWYNLGLALNSQGKTQEALDVLAQGAAANPGDAALPYVRATILANQGRRQEAEMEVFKALNIQPGMPEALELRQALQRPGPGAR